MRRPARAKPTLSLRWSIDVEPSCERTTSSMACTQQVVVVVVAAAAAGAHRAGPAPSSAPCTDCVVGEVGRLPLPHLATTLRTSSSLTQEPWMRDGRRRGRAEQEHVALADQPLGALLVEDHAAVGGRRHREREAGRHVGLDHAGDDVDRRALRGDHEVDADGAGHLRDAADRVLDVAGGDHHQVGELVDHDEDERQPRELPLDLAGGRDLVGQVAAVEGGVVAGDVAEADLGEQVVAALHLA